MHADALGFLYPVVDNSKCVECGLCEKVCQFHDNYNRYNNYEEPLAYSLRIREELQLSRSQSGGAFYGIAKYVIENGGVVYGAAFNFEWKVCHQRANTIDDLEKQRMSKYVQSDMRGVFPMVKNDLKQGRVVLYTGTACQVAGLKSYIPPKMHNNLICVDIICHGVPSPQIWADYIDYLQKRYRSRIVKACFRDKRYGWHGARETFKFENGKEVTRRTSNRMYFAGLSMRESCASCKFTNLKRVSDLTIGDYWGLPKNSPYEQDNKGVSLLLINSDIGLKILKNIECSFFINKLTTKDWLQPQLQYPSKMSYQYENFVRDYISRGFLFVGRKYSDMSLCFYLNKIFNDFLSFGGNLLRKLGLKRYK